MCRRKDVIHQPATVPVFSSATRPTLIGKTLLMELWFQRNGEQTFACRSRTALINLNEKVRLHVKATTTMQSLHCTYRRAASLIQDSDLNQKCSLRLRPLLFSGCHDPYAAVCLCVGHLTNNVLVFTFLSMTVKRATDTLHLTLQLMKTQLKHADEPLPCMLTGRQTPGQPGFLCILP